MNKQHFTIVRRSSIQLLANAMSGDKAGPAFMYEAQNNSSGAFFWFTKDHAKSLGQALSNKKDTVKVFFLNVTMTEPGALKVLSENIKEGTTLEAFGIAHKSGDEFTVEEGKEFAEVIHKLKASSLTVWSGEFDEGSVDAIASTLKSLNNTTVKSYEICDVSVPEPNDQIKNPELDTIVQKNSGK